MLIELPYIYQAEVLYPRKRKTNMINILDTSIFDMDLSDAENIAISILPNKKHYQEDECCIINDVTLFKNTDYGFITNTNNVYEQNTNNYNELMTIIKNNFPIKIRKGMEIDLKDKQKCINFLNFLDKNTITFLSKKNITTEDEITKIKKHISDNIKTKILDMNNNLKNYFICDSNVFKKNDVSPYILIKNSPSYTSLDNYMIPFQIISDINEKYNFECYVKIPIGYIDIIEKYTQLIENNSKQKTRMVTKQENQRILVINPNIDIETIFGKPEKIILDSMITILKKPSCKEIIENTIHGKDLILLIENCLNNNCSDNLMEHFYLSITLFEREIENTVKTRGQFLNDIYHHMMILQRLKDIKYLKIAINYYYDKKNKNELKNIIKSDENNMSIFEKQNINFDELFSKKESVLKIK